MQKFDLHAVSIPDHRAQMAVAQLIVGTNSQISMQTAMDMAKSPPVLLYHNIEQNDAKQFMSHLNSFGVGFKLSETEPAPEEIETEKHRQEAQTSGAVDENVNGGDTEGGSETNDPLSQFAQIKDHNIGVKKGTPPNDGHDTPSNAAAQHHPTPEELQKSIMTAIGHHHNDDGRKNSHSGLRIGGIGLDDLAKAEEAARRRNLQIAIGAATFFLIIGLILYFMPDHKNIVVNRAPVVTKRGGKPASGRSRNTQENAAAPREISARDTQDKLRSQISDAQRLQANAMVDSARTAADDHDKIISFYKMAISFNRYNMQAWQGLLQAYRDTGRTQEAQETEKQIREIFGDEAMTVNNLARQFGDIIDAYMNDDGMYRLEYRTSKRSRDDILREVFTMTRSVRSACKCRDISIYASTGPGRGLIVHSTSETSVHKLSTFSMQAGIVWLD